MNSTGCFSRSLSAANSSLRYIKPGFSDWTPRNSGTERCSSTLDLRMTHCRLVSFDSSKTLATDRPALPNPMRPTFTLSSFSHGRSALRVMPEGHTPYDPARATTPLLWTMPKTAHATGSTLMKRPSGVRSSRVLPAAPVNAQGTVYHTPGGRHHTSGGRYPSSSALRRSPLQLPQRFRQPAPRRFPGVTLHRVPRRSMQVIILGL